MNKDTPRYYDPELPADSVMGNGPLVYFQRPLDEIVELDIDATVSFLKDHNVAQTTLDHLAISFEKPYVDIIFGRTAQVLGSMSRSSRLENGEIYSPLVSVYSKPEVVQERKLNSTFRHELGHVINCDDNRPPYRDRNLLSSVKALGLCTLTYDVLSTSAYTGSLESGLVGLGATALGAFLASSPANAIHSLSPREIKANYFAWRHRGFNPIRVK